MNDDEGWRPEDIPESKRQHFFVGDDGLMYVRLNERVSWIRPRDVRQRLMDAFGIDAQSAIETARLRLISGHIVASAGSVSGPIKKRERCKVDGTRDWIAPGIWPYVKMDEGLWSVGDIQLRSTGSGRVITYTDVRFLEDNVLSMMGDDGRQSETPDPTLARSLDDKFTLEGAISLGLKGRYIRSDFPLILEIHQEVVAGRGSYSGIAMRLAARAEGAGVESKGKRLQRLYRDWEQLGE